MTESKTTSVQRQLDLTRQAHLEGWSRCSPRAVLRSGELRPEFASDDFGNFIFQPTFTGNAFGDFLERSAHDAELCCVQPRRGRNSDSQFSLFAQDEFQLNSRLTLATACAGRFFPVSRRMAGTSPTSINEQLDRGSGCAGRVPDTAEH